MTLKRSSPLRVAIDARVPNGLYGGVQQVIVGLASGLSSLDDGDEQYFFLVHDDSCDWLEPHLSDPCRPLYVGCLPRKGGLRRWANEFLPGSAFLWGRFAPLLGERAAKVPVSDGTIERIGVDVMHFTTQSAFVTRVPSIYHPHDLQHLHLPQFFTPYNRFARETRYRCFCEQADTVAVATDWVRQDVIRHYGLPASKVRVIHLAPLLGTYKRYSEADLHDVRNRLGLGSEFIFYPAQTWPHKNHLALIEALAILRRTYGDNVALVCCGTLTEHYAKIENRVRSLGLDTSVRFLGFVDAATLSALYQMCTVVVIPTLFEAGSFLIWESFQAGKPVACSRVTSLPEQTGGAALLFDPQRPEDIAYAVHRLWTSPALQHEFVARGAQRINNLSWDGVARTFRAHYRRISGRMLTDEDRVLLEQQPIY